MSAAKTVAENEASAVTVAFARRWRRLFGAAAVAATLFAGGAVAQTEGATDAPAEAATPAEPAPLSASPVSARIADVGLETVEAELAALAEPTPQDLFLLAGVRFLRGVERAAQERYRVGAGQVDFAPMLRLPLPENPEPEPFEPGIVETVFKGVLDDMRAVEAALARLPDAALEDPAFGATLSLDDLWIDVNRNGERDEAGPITETVMDLSGFILDAPLRGMRGTLVRFDAADVAWLRAYAHFLSGVSEFILALDPTRALSEAAPGWEAAAEYETDRATAFGVDQWVDQAAATLMLLRGRPDGVRTRRALAHFESMIAENRIFWSRVAAETDDQAEWIPNPTQRSALGGVQISQETADAWVAVLADAEKLLKGEALAPYWRYVGNDGAPVGLNIRRILEDPAPADLVLWIQGAAAAPYLETGDVVSAESWRAFTRLVGGQALAFAVWFN